MPKIKEFRIFYTGLLVLTLIMCFAYASRLMPYLLIVLITAPLLSFLVLCINYKAVKITQTPAEIIAEKKNECDVKLRIRNRGILPITPIVINGLFFSTKGDGITSRSIITDVKPLANVVLDMPFVSKYRGEYLVGVESFEVFDLFKLFKLKKTINMFTTVVVLPRNIDIDMSQDVNEAEDSYKSLIHGLNKTTFSSLREYRPGDDTRHIHWKLTAKQGDFIVKQMEQIISNNSVIFCDFSAQDGKTDIHYQMMSDAVIEAALAIARKISFDGNTATICWQNSATSQYECLEISDNNQYRQLYYEFALLPFTPCENTFEDLLCFFANEINTQRTVYLLTHKISEGFIKYLEEIGLIERNDVTVLLFSTSAYNTSYIEYLLKETSLTLRFVDVENISKTLSEL